jgi:hypothetical protein
MRYATWKAFPALFALLIASSGALPQTADNSVTAYVDGDREAVIAFLPPVIEHSRGTDAVEARDQVISALESVKRCMGEDRADYRVVYAERIVVRSLEGNETFEVSHFAPLVGALLLRPGANARILFAGGGPEALMQLLKQEAKEYFGQDCDGR